MHPPNLPFSWFVGCTKAEGANSSDFFGKNDVILKTMSGIPLVASGMFAQSVDLFMGD
jgi:hypothetical protein